MTDLGNDLRQAREEKGISLAEAAAATRIKERYLKALEANDWAALPTAVQARGFLRNYATYLGMDKDQVMASFSQVTRSARVSLPLSPTTDSPVPTTSENGAVFRPRDIDIEGLREMPSWLSSDILIGVALAVVVALLGFGLLSLVSGNSDETPAVDTAAPVLVPPATVSASQPVTSTGVPPDTGTSVPTTPTFDASAGGVQLVLEATEHVWVRVTVDDAQVLEGILKPEDGPQTWQGTRQIKLETPNSAGFQAVVNGQPQGSLGERGQTVILAWGPDGPVTPAPAAAP